MKRRGNEGKTEGRTVPLARRRTVMIAASLSIFPAVPLSAAAQCPDGFPPPCRDAVHRLRDTVPDYVVAVGQVLRVRYLVEGSVRPRRDARPRLGPAAGPGRRLFGCGAAPAGSDLRDRIRTPPASRADDLQQAVDNLRHLLRRSTTQTLADPLDGEGANLTDLDPGPLR